MTLRPHTPLSSLLRAGFAALLLAVATVPALAEKADRTKPMNIEADAMRYDDLKQTSVFTGNVVVTKGTIIIRGARIDVRQDPEGYQYGVVTAAPGKLAYYKQKRDSGVDEWTEGESEVIEYDSRADNVKFIRRAIMRRLIGAKVNESTLAYVIGGYSWQHFNLHGSVAGGGSGDIYDWGSSGFSIGGGLETAVSNNMTVGLEYRYSQYEKEDFGSGGLLEDTPRIQTVRIGAKYKFN